MKKIPIFIVLLLAAMIVPLTLARENQTQTVESVAFIAVNATAAISAETTAEQLPVALNTQNRDLLKNVLLRNDVRFGSYYGAWWDGWETISTDDMLAQIWRYDALGQLSAETLPNEPTWFLQNQNPYTDLLTDESVAVVLLIGNFSENSDAEMLVWISADAKVSAMVLSATGFQRVSR